MTPFEIIANSMDRIHKEITGTDAGYAEMLERGSERVCDLCNGTGIVIDSNGPDDYDKIHCPHCFEEIDMDDNSDDYRG